MVVHLCGRRLRAHPVAELLAGAGVAIGVALVFGVLLANTSLTSSASTLVHSITGRASFELVSPSSQGFSAHLARRAGMLHGVEVAAPVLRRQVTLRGPSGSETVQLVGLSPSVEDLGGLATQELAAGAQLLHGGIGLPADVAEAIGARRHGTVRVLAAGLAARASVRLVLGGSLTSLAATPVAVSVLGVARRLAHAPGLVSEVLVKPLPGKRALVGAELRRLGAGLQVRPASSELRLLGVATAPSRRSTSLFTATAVMIGFLLALSAVLLTVPEKRRFIAELRLQGYEGRQIALVLGLQALLIGLLASAVGIALGGLISHLLFERSPRFLTAAFPVGAEERIGAAGVLAALACGVLAAGIASLAPLVELRRGGTALGAASAGEARSERIAPRTALASALLGALLIAVAVAIALASAQLTIISGVALALAAVCLVPGALSLVVNLLPRALQRVRSAALIVALAELRAVTMRSAALAGVVALAVYGGIAIGGAREDLLRGVKQATAQYFATAPVWVTAGKDVFNTNGFPASGPAAAVARASGVAGVRRYRGGLLDVGDRRMWVRARPAADAAMIESSQLVEGSYDAATAEIRRGGWAAISSAFASERGLHVGDRFALPTPTGQRRLRVAAVLTNSGWPPGTITINASEYARWWAGQSAVAALEVSLKPGVGAVAGAAAVRRALGAYPGLVVQTASQRAAQSAASAKQGLRTLGEISLLVLIAAALAVAAALSATIAQRRPRLAALKVQGYSTAQLWGAVLIESSLTILSGLILGAVLGVAGHALAGRYLQLTTGFPAPFAPGAGQALLTLALFTAIALAVIAIPGRVAARVPARGALQD